MRPKILTLSGPSGAGKTTIARNLLDLLPNAKMVVSNTTRAARVSDIPGEYNHIEMSEFQTLESKGKFLWTAEHGGTHYGTLCQSVFDAATADDRIGIMILTPNVMPILSSYLSNLNANTEHIPVFLSAPTDILTARLNYRGESAQSIQTRLFQSADWERDCRASVTPFHFFQNVDSIDDAVNYVLSLL